MVNCGKRVGAVAGHTHAQRGTQSAAIADIGVVDALAVRVLLALGVRGIEVEADRLSEASNFRLMPI